MFYKVQLIFADFEDAKNILHYKESTWLANWVQNPLALVFILVMIDH